MFAGRTFPLNFSAGAPCGLSLWSPWAKGRSCLHPCLSGWPPACSSITQQSPCLWGRPLVCCPLPLFKTSSGTESLLPFSPPTLARCAEARKNKSFPACSLFKRVGTVAECSQTKHVLLPEGSLTGTTALAKYICGNSRLLDTARAGLSVLSMSKLPW